ncbi:penicillin-binding protein activator LpoB [Halodesulfovibrio spirochaetisodalis]|uniref:Penicillin-binding protein activator LpoB n=1 Tax=Halodesulfovibrio spirochaetisodalis TaxID=1560234 RepID=A0A1B7XBI1_9BACT|nr:penicillin-binding protein activator LpoB [Halodesulfovibrio spirochaetisodalis]OBQ46687.1 membrane protein [Halodesulfovibrio spirochaetisodalis]
MKKLIIFTLLALIAVTTGCGKRNEATMIDPNNDKNPRIMGLGYRDFEQAASTAVQEMFSSGAVNKPDGGRYIMVVSRVLNDTMQNIDTDLLVKKIRVDLLRSGRVITTTAMGINGAEDPMVAKARKLRNNDEVNQKNVARKGKIVAPELSLSGKIIQRNHRIDSSTDQIEYFFMLTLTEIETGLAIWEGETPIIKRGDSGTVNW